MTTKVPPAGYEAIERALWLFDQDEGSRWIAAKLDGVDHPAAREAAHLLRAGERQAARRVLGQALWKMAGPPDGRGLDWWSPRHPGDFKGRAERNGPTLG